VARILTFAARRKEGIFKTFIAAANVVARRERLPCPTYNLDMDSLVLIACASFCAWRSRFLGYCPRR